MVWDPHFKKDKLLLESVQHFALKIIDRSWHAESSNALRLNYGLPTLEARRSYFSTLTTFEFFKWYLYVAAPNLRTCHNYQLVQPFARCNSLYNSFFIKSVRLWNSLPASIIDSDNNSSISFFMSDNFIRSVFLTE